MSLLRLGVTMRCATVEYPGNVEERDALATDWGRFLALVLPEAVWLPLPNTGTAAVELAQVCGLTGLVLSGGDTWGQCPRRDATETALLEWARQSRRPVLGVCRGAQVLHRLTGGGPLAPVAGHVASRHAVCLASGVQYEVNSFHALGMAACGLAGDMLPEALTTDGVWVEAIRHRELPWLGLLWHPERESDPAPADRAYVRNLFLGHP